MEQLTPLTREEEVLNTLLQAANGEAVEDLNPEWRKEQWFQNILDAIKGNELTYDLISEWRREDWYQAFIDAIQEGGGGGSVPEYSGSYTVTPTEQTQTLATDGKKMTDDVTVNPISSTYIGSGVTQKAAATYTPTTSDQTIAANQYLSGAQTVKGDANLVSGNIKKDTQIFGVTGTYEGSGGGVVEAPMKDVNFYDYDGTRLYSYTAQEFLALSAMPANPTHSGLTAQGWNWTLADAKDQVTAMGVCDIGQMYVTDDGKTRVYITVPSERLSIYLGFGLNGTANIEWGDGSSNTVTGSGLSTIKNTQHTYSTSGNYVINIEAVNGQISLAGVIDGYSYFSKLINNNKSSPSQEYAYYNMIDKVEIGNGVVSIGDCCFIWCYSIKTITIPNTVTYIGIKAFNNTVDLECAIVPAGITSIPEDAFNSSGCYVVVLPNSVLTLGTQSLRCSRLRVAFLPDGITTIDGSTFSSRSLEKIYIPQSVTSIGGNLVQQGYTLAELHFFSSVPPTVTSGSMFQNVPNDCKIYVPYSEDHSVLDAYKSATNYPSSATYTYVEE